MGGDDEIELTEVDLTGILPSATIMVVTVTASTTIGTPLPEAALAAVTDSCEQVLTLADNKQKMLAFVESRMSTVAPNISALVGVRGRDVSRAHGWVGVGRGEREWR